MRIPAELISRICSVLQAQASSKTPASLQTCSRNLYCITTPYLYRHLHLSPFVLEHLIDLLFDPSQDWNGTYLPRDHDTPHYMSVPVNIEIYDVPGLKIPRSVWIRSLFRSTRYITVVEDEGWDIEKNQATHLRMFSALHSYSRNLFSNTGVRLWPSLISVNLDVTPIRLVPVSPFCQACRPSELRVMRPLPNADLEYFVKPFNGSTKHVRVIEGDMQDLPGTGTASLTISYKKAKCGKNCPEPDHSLEGNPSRGCGFETLLERARKLHQAGVFLGSQECKEWSIIQGDGVVLEGKEGIQIIMDKLQNLINQIPTTMIDDFDLDIYWDEISAPKREEYHKRGKAFLEALKVIEE